MSLRSVSAAVAVASLFAVVGCSSSSDAVGASTDGVASATSAQDLAGAYWTATPVLSGFVRLTLATDGTYSATVEAGPNVVCIAAPCTFPEVGTWSSFARPDGSHVLQISPEEEPRRDYEALLVDDGVTLTRNGVVETLTSLAPNGCFEDSDCGFADRCQRNEECSASYASGDPTSCGPSVCVPRQGATCAAMLCGPDTTCVEDPNGDAACVPNGPSPCGEATCAPGQLCCNALAGICAAPGEVCAF